MATVRCITIGLIVSFALGLLAAPLSVDAQQAGKVYRIGWLAPTLGQHDAVTPFLEKFSTLGWVEGKHFVMEQRIAPAGQIGQLDTLAADLVKHNVDIIVAVSTPGCLAAQQATSTIPVGAAEPQPPSLARQRRFW